MSRILLNLAVTLDGFIEGPNGEFDWCLTDQDYGMTNFLARCEAIIFGRKSYELLLQYEENPYPDKMKYVFSNTIGSVAGKAAVVNGPLADAVDKIKQRTQGDIWFFGGAALLEPFMRYNLIDEMHLSVHPLLLGSGKPLFSGLTERKQFQLQQVETFSSGLVQLVYQIHRQER
jgi:dihydrofolate reductase